MVAALRLRSISILFSKINSYRVLFWKSYHSCHPSRPASLHVQLCKSYRNFTETANKLFFRHRLLLGGGTLCASVLALLYMHRSLGQASNSKHNVKLMFDSLIDIHNSTFGVRYPGSGGDSPAELTVVDLVPRDLRPEPWLTHRPSRCDGLDCCPE